MSELDTEFKKAGKRKVVIEVDYNDVDDLITRHFPNMNGTYEIVAYEEWGNYQDHSFDIDGTSSIDDRDRIHEMLKSGKWPHYNTATMLDYLCSLGVIEPATYLVTVFW